MKCRRSIKYLLISLLLVFFLVLPFKGKIHAESHGEKNINFRWAFVARIEEDQRQQYVSITRSAVLKTGDRIKMFVEPQKCFVYFIHRSEADEIELLFPFSLQQFDNERETTRKHFIPMGDEWFEMYGNASIETFYLVASSSRLSEMEELLAKHARAQAAEREKIAKEILEAIQNLKKKYRTIVADAERPMSIGGSIRDITQNKKTGSLDFEQIANPISATNFYSRTFTIDHR